MNRIPCCPGRVSATRLAPFARSGPGRLAGVLFSRPPACSALFKEPRRVPRAGRGRDKLPRTAVAPADRRARVWSLRPPIARYFLKGETMSTQNQVTTAAQLGLSASPELFDL
jgi:hypothetical protein